MLPIEIFIKKADEVSREYTGYTKWVDHEKQIVRILPYEGKKVWTQIYPEIKEEYEEPGVMGVPRLPPHHPTQR